MQPELKLQQKLKDAEKGELRYPIDPSDVDKSPEPEGERLKETDYIKFERFPKPTPATPEGGNGEKKVFLFVPPQSLNYTRSYTYAEEEQTFVSAKETLKKISDPSASGFEKFFGAFGAAASDLKRAGLKAAFGNPAAQQGAGQFGYAFNPNMEVYFKQPNFRTFEFTFPFLPKNEKESVAVEEIVSEFEKYSMPELSKDKNIYKYPKVWQISTKAKIGKGFNSRTCVLESFNVNYGADAGYTTFIDGKPVMTTLKLSFKEIELWSQDMFPK